MGNSLFDSLFSSESCVFFSQIHPPLKIYHVWLFIIIKKGLQWLLDNVGFVLSQVLNAEKLVFYSFWNPSMHAHARVHAELKYACAYACMRTHILGFSWSSFSKNSLFSPKKSYIFLKTFPQINFHPIGL